MGLVINTRNSGFIWGGGALDRIFNMDRRVFMDSVDFNTYFEFYPPQDFRFNVRSYAGFCDLLLKSPSPGDLEYYWEVRIKVDSKLRWCRVRMVLSSDDREGALQFPIGVITDITEIKLDNYLVFYAFNKKSRENLITRKEWAFPLDVEVLTDREQDIVKMIAEGFLTKQIADKLYISENTIKVHKQRIFKKLGVKNSIEMMREVCKRKLVEWP